MFNFFFFNSCFFSYSFFEYMFIVYIQISVFLSQHWRESVQNTYWEYAPITRKCNWMRASTRHLDHRWAKFVIDFQKEESFFSPKISKYWNDTEDNFPNSLWRNMHIRRICNKSKMRMHRASPENEYKKLNGVISCVLKLWYTWLHHAKDSINM